MNILGDLEHWIPTIGQRPKEKAYYAFAIIFSVIVE